MHHTWEDQVQEYWRTGALLEGDGESTRYINRDLQAEPGRVLPRALWLQSREMPMAERRELDVLWVRLTDIAKADAERADPRHLDSGALDHRLHSHSATSESPALASCDLRLYELTANVPYCDGCRDVTWFLGRVGRRQPVAPYEVLIKRNRELPQDPEQCDYAAGLEHEIGSFFTEDEARLVEMLLPLNGNLRVTKRRLPLPYCEYHHRFYVLEDSVHIRKTLRFNYELPFPISIYYDLDWEEGPGEDGKM